MCKQISYLYLICENKLHKICQKYLYNFYMYLFIFYTVTTPLLTVSMEVFAILMNVFEFTIARLLALTYSIAAFIAFWAPSFLASVIITKMLTRLT